MMGWQWHQMNHMHAICTSLQKKTMPAPHQLDFTGRMPFLTPSQQHQNTEGQVTSLWNLVPNSELKKISPQHIDHQYVLSIKLIDGPDLLIARAKIDVPACYAQLHIPTAHHSLIVIDLNSITLICCGFVVQSKAYSVL